VPSARKPRVGLPRRMTPGEEDPDQEWSRKGAPAEDPRRSGPKAASVRRRPGGKFGFVTTDFFTSTKAGPVRPRIRCGHGVATVTTA
jgi:hypothetical protein